MKTIFINADDLKGRKEPYNPFEEEADTQKTQEQRIINLETQVEVLYKQYEKLVTHFKELVLIVAEKNKDKE